MASVCKCGHFDYYHEGTKCLYISSIIDLNGVESKDGTKYSVQKCGCKNGLASQVQ